jgi:hypothetical protein
MKFLTRWLGLEPPGARVGLRPHRDVELAAGYDRAYEACRDAIERVLGAAIAIDDPKGGLIEAAFGLVNSERLRCTLTRVDDAHTGVRIEAIFSAGVEVPKTSRNVEALADALSSK